MPEPTETPRLLFRRAARGRDPATPALVISGVTQVIAGAVAIVLAIAFLVYFPGLGRFRLARSARPVIADGRTGEARAS